MEIPYEELSVEALRGIIEHYVLGEGTDYGQVEFTFDQKIAAVTAQLKAGKVKIIFDEQEEACVIVPSWKG